MRISSKLHPQIGPAMVLVLDVMAGNKPFLAGILIGDVTASPPTASEIGNEVLRRLRLAMDQTTAGGSFHLASVTSPRSARQRVREVAAAVRRHEAVAFFCADDETCAAVVRELNLHG